MSDRLLRAALWYAGRGWPVHPLRPRAKLPLLRGWMPARWCPRILAVLGLRHA